MYNNKTWQKLKAQLLREWEYILLQLENDIAGNCRNQVLKHIL